jgi:L-glyceraldehyde 3-phosphate reductase
VFSPLGQGLLSDKYLAGIPEGSRATKAHGFLKPKDITETKLAKIRQLDVLAKRRGQSLAQMALAWVLRRPTVTSALIGASRVAQIEEGVAALANLGFSAEELAAIEGILG